MAQFFLLLLLFSSGLSSLCFTQLDIPQSRSWRKLILIRTTPLLTQEPSPNVVYVRYWSTRWGRWLTIQTLVDPNDTVQDIINKVIRRSHGELNAMAILYLDEIPLPKRKRLFPYWLNEVLTNNNWAEEMMPRVFEYKD